MRQLAMFTQMLEKLFGERNTELLLEKAVNKISSLLKAERATIYFLNEDTQELWSSVAKKLAVGEIRVPVGQGIAGKVAVTKKSIAVRDAYRSSFISQQVDAKTGFRTRSVLCSPLLDAHRDVIGVIQVLNKKKGTFTRADQNVLEKFAFYLTLALENDRLYQEKETLFRSTLYALTGAIDAKDHATAGHSYRVAYFSVKIGQALCLSERQLKVLEYAAFLHDVGKIGIPDRVLQKKGALTAKEYELIKKHPLYTLQILKNIIFPKDLRDIVSISSSHHEFLNGKGYPFGVKEDQIDLLTRIITVADVYDALVSFDRSYKRHMTQKKALMVLRQEVRKKHLDKNVVNVLISKQLYKYERRDYKRIDLHTSIRYQIIPQRRVFREAYTDRRMVKPFDLDVLHYRKGESSDVSEGGLLFLSKQYIPVGTYLDLQLKIITIRIHGIGKVVWADKAMGASNYRVGVSFVNLPRKMRIRLAAALEKAYRKKKVNS